MGQPINIVAQDAMDDFYQNYRSDSDFFTLDDFISRCGQVAADVYQKEWQRQYAEIRQERKPELVSYDPTWLNEQVLKVEEKDSVRFAKLQQPIMSFLYDQQSCGIQYVFRTKPGPEIELERQSLAEGWQLKYTPFSDKIYFTPQSDRITFSTNGNCNVVNIKVLYVPAIGANMIIADGITNIVISEVVRSMREEKQGTIVKKSIDGNPNTVLQTEMNPALLKQ